MSNQQVRLNKFLAERLGVSRREADDLISAGKITIDNQKAQLGDRVDIDKNTKICYKGKALPLKADYFYLALNKPVGYVCSRHAQGHAPTLYELLPQKYHQLKTVGRLDKDSSGLILLTNDGDFAYRMTHPKFRKSKVYEVELDKPLAPLHQQMISDFGVQLDDGISRFKIIRRELPDNTFPEKVGPEKGVTDISYIVILQEGRNRQIRRTFAALGYTVTRLHRTQFGKYELGNLKSAKYVIIEP